MARIGFVGTGIMGMPMAMNLLKAGHQVKVWNRTSSKAESLKEAGVYVCSELEQVGKDVEFLICMLSDGKTCNEILFQERGAISQLKPESTVIVMSSIPVEVAKTQSEKCKERGLRYLDAPVSGGEKVLKMQVWQLWLAAMLKHFHMLNMFYLPWGDQF